MASKKTRRPPLPVRPQDAAEWRQAVRGAYIMGCEPFLVDDATFAEAVEDAARDFRAHAPDQFAAILGRLGKEAEGALLVGLKIGWVVGHVDRAMGDAAYSRPFASKGGSVTRDEKTTRDAPKTAARIRAFIRELQFPAADPSGVRTRAVDFLLERIRLGGLPGYTYRDKGADKESPKLSFYPSGETWAAWEVSRHRLQNVISEERRRK